MTADRSVAEHAELGLSATAHCVGSCLQRRQGGANPHRYDVFDRLP